MSYLEILCNNTDNKRINLPKVDYPPDISNKVKQIKYHQIMLSNKVIDYLNKQGVYSEKEDKAYIKALIDL